MQLLRGSVPFRSSRGEDLAICPAIKGISSFFKIREGGSFYISSYQEDSSFLQFIEGRVQLYVQLSRGSVSFYSLERGGSSYMSSYQGNQFLFIVQRGSTQLYVQTARGSVPFYSSEREYLAICPASKGTSSFLFILQSWEDLQQYSSAFSSFLQFIEGRIQLYVQL